MKRSMSNKIIITLMAISMIFILLLAGCSTQTTETDVSYAGPMLDNVLNGIKDKDYAAFSQDFSSSMKSAFTQEQFDAMVTLLESKIGDYEGKTLSGSTVTKNNNQAFTVVVYKAKYSKESGDVQITISFSDDNGKKSIEGLFFNSPNLRK